MTQFSFERDKELDGVVLITPFSATDERGGFTKYFEKGVYHENGLDFDVFEEFITTSSKNVIRGLHFQTVNPQSKLVTTLSGAIHDIVVDLRIKSPTFGKWKGFSLTSENKKTLLVPKGFAHGFLALEEQNTVSYKCDTPFLKKYDGGIIWNDKELAIQWPANAPIISEKDGKLVSFSEFCEGFGGF